MDCYYKLRQLFYYKLRQVLQSAMIITNCDSTAVNESLDSFAKKKTKTKNKTVVSLATWVAFQVWYGIPNWKGSQGLS